MTHGDPYFQELPQEQRIRLKKQLAASLAACQEILFAYIFGSFVDERYFRDIDVGLYLDPVRIPAAESEEYRERCSEKLADMFHLDFDVSIINNVPESFKLAVFLTGELLFSRDEALRTDMLESSSLTSLVDEAISMQSFREIVL
jgi:predicted nucleotidyltransferase